MAYVIAEMAWSHTGSLETALKLVRGARQAGADAIGIHLTSLPDYMVPDYRSLAGTTLSDRDVSSPPTIYKYLEKINLGEPDWRAIVAEARKVGIELVTMCNDEPSFEFAESIGAADRYVIAAACFTELEFVKRVARANKPILLRIGGATISEIDDVVTAIRNEGNSDITLLLGVQTYPTDISQTYIASLPKIRSAFGCAVGLADHIDGALPEAITLPALALAFGATAIEKHITTAREDKLEDFEAALGIEQFGEFVRYLRTAQLALGNGEIPTDSEAANRYRMVVRKRVVAARDLPAGAVLGHDDVAFKRADDGLPVEQLNRIVGRRLNGAVPQNAGLTPDMFATGQ